MESFHEARQVIGTITDKIISSDRGKVTESHRNCSSPLYLNNIESLPWEGLIGFCMAGKCRKKIGAYLSSVYAKECASLIIEFV